MKFQNIFSVYIIAFVFTIYPIIAEPIVSFSMVTFKINIKSDLLIF